MILSGQVATCPYGTTTTSKINLLLLRVRKETIVSRSYRTNPSLWVERLVDFWWRSHCEVRAKEMYTARCPYRGPLPPRRGLAAV